MSDPLAPERVSIEIRRDTVEFEFENRPYEGKPDLSAETLGRLDKLREDGASPMTYGAELYRATFREDAKSGLEAIARKADTGPTVRIRLAIDVDDAPLHSLWWEALHFPDSPRPVGCRNDTPLSRYMKLIHYRDVIEAAELKVLVVVADPVDLGKGKWERLPPLGGGKLLSNLDTVLGQIDRIKPVIAPQASPGRIADLLKDEGCHILHIVAHGGFSEGEGYVLLEDDEGRASPVNEDWLGNIVQNVTMLQLILLVSCQGAAPPSSDAFTRPTTDAFKGMAPKLLKYGVPGVVAMQDSIELERAERFTDRFYRALASEKLTLGFVDAAVNDARSSMKADHPNSWDCFLPVLFLQGEGKVFAPTEVSVGGALTKQPITASQRAPTAAGAPPAEQPTGLRPPPEEADAPRPEGPIAPSTPSLAVQRSPARRLEERLSGFDEKSFRRLCLDLSVPYRDLGDDDLEIRKMALVDIYMTSGRLDELERMMAMRGRGPEPAGQVFDIATGRQIGFASGTGD